MESNPVNPECVVWSHSNSRSDYYEVPTNGAEMHEALGWLLDRYKKAKLWMGAESGEGTEIYFICSPAQPELVEQLSVPDQELLDPNLFGLLAAHAGEA